MSTRVIAFGAYDTRKPRVRLLLAQLRRAGALAQEIAIGGWEEVAQTNVPSKRALAGIAARMAMAYPRALWRLWRSEKGAAILLPYPGIIEILLVAPIARATRRRIVLDAFLPLYDTIVVDRELLREGSWRARAIHLFERLALACADVIVTDTEPHAAYFAQEFGIARSRFETVLVGAEPQFAPAAADQRADLLLGPDDGRPIVLFYGQLIPLHGLPTILAAARAYRGAPARWVVIGRGQLEPLMREVVKEQGGKDEAKKHQGRAPLEWIEWVDYEALPAVIARASVCLGVFGASDKAARVIPNKLFQQLACGKSVITRASPAVDDLAARFPAALRTVPPADPQALADAVAAALADPAALAPLPCATLAELGPQAGVRQLLARLERGE